MSRGARVGVYADLSYRRSGADLHAEEAFAIFAAALRDHVDTLVLVGRLDSGSTLRYPHRLRDDVEFVGLPFYGSLVAPAAVGRVVAASLARFWRVLGRVDTVWLLGPHPLAVVFAVLAVLRRRRVVLGVRQDFPAYVRSRHPRHRWLVVAADVLEWIWRGLARGLPTVVVGAELEHRYRRARRLLPVTVSLVDAAQLRAQRRAAPFRRNDHELRVLSVGRLDPEKNPLLLADMLARLRASDDRWRLIVCGGGKLEASLAARLEQLGLASHAELRGVVDLDSVRAAYDSSDLLVLVSRTEGVPQVLLEAFASGIPVVATDVGGIGRAVKNAAVLVPPDDAGALAAALQRLAADGNERARLASAGLARARRHTMQAEARRVAAMLTNARDNAPLVHSSVMAMRHSWVWMVIPPECRRVQATNPPLASVLTEAGLELSTARPEAVLIAHDDVRGRRELHGAVRRLDPPGIVAIAIGGGTDHVLEGAAAPVRALQLAASPVVAAATRVRAARAAYILRCAGLHVSGLATGDRTRRHGLERGIVRRRHRLPVGRVVVGSAERPRPSVVKAAVAAAGESIGTRLRVTAVTGLESGKLLVELTDWTRRGWVLRVAALPARVQLDCGLVALEKLAAAGPGPAVRNRVAWPVACGEAGLARWSLERKAPGRHPRAMTARLWCDCHAFLVALHRIGRDAATADAVRLDELLRGQARHIGAHTDDASAAALERIASALVERLARVPLGWAHGDFWGENLLVGLNGLGTVVDWDWAEPRGLPVLDIMDLIAHSRRRIGADPPGQRLLETLWPLARTGGDRRLRSYCAALGTPADAQTLEALAVAYWLDRTARDLRPFDDRPRQPAWLQSNIQAPLAALETAGW